MYYKPYNQGSLIEIEKSGYKHLGRNQMIPLLETYAADSDLVAMYLEHIRAIDEAVLGFTVLPAEQWNSTTWSGFYTFLQKELNDGDWRYVNNPTGGFMGFWWNWHDYEEDCQQYLQLEEGKLCFKIDVEDTEKRTLLRNYWSDQILQVQMDLNIRRPARFGKGHYMTVAHLEGDYRVFVNGKLDVADTLKNLRQAMAVLDALGGDEDDEE